MKIKPQTEALAKILEITNRAVKPNGAVAILGSVLFDADKEKGTLKIAATDMELSISVNAGDCDVEESGVSAIRAGLLANIVKSIDDEHAKIESTDSEATLSTENGSYSIKAYNAEDFPKLPEFPTEKDSYFEVPSQALAKAIDQILPFTSNDHNRPVLTGALVNFEDGNLSIASTDSYRLGVAMKALKGAPKEKVSQIIPARGLKEVARLASMTEKIRVSMNENQAMFSANGVTIATRLIDGQFPEYQRLMPPGFEKTFRVNRKTFIESLRRVNLFCANTNPPAAVRLSFNSSQESLMGDELVIAGSNTEIGQGREVISYSDETESEKTEGEKTEGVSFTAAFNPSYLMAALTTAGGADVLMKFNESLKPAMVFPAETGEEDPDLKMLLMPMRDPAAEEAAARPTRTKAKKKPENKEEESDQSTETSNTEGSEQTETENEKVPVGAPETS